MKRLEDLVRGYEYWLEKIQNDLFRKVHSFMEDKDFNRTQLAKHLGFSKGYISQVLNGDFNHSLKKLIKLSLVVGQVPLIEFKPIEDYISELKSSASLVVSMPREDNKVVSDALKAPSVVLEGTSDSDHNGHIDDSFTWAA
jgi:transcriptional regulator with XRE-family HTH domain